MLRSASTLLQALGGRVDAALATGVRQMLRKVVFSRERLQLVFSTVAVRAVLGLAAAPIL